MNLNILSYIKYLAGVQDEEGNTWSDTTGSYRGLKELHPLDLFLVADYKPEPAISEATFARVKSKETESLQEHKESDLICQREGCGNPFSHHKFNGAESSPLCPQLIEGKQYTFLPAPEPQPRKKTELCPDCGGSGLSLNGPITEPSPQQCKNPRCFGGRLKPDAEQKSNPSATAQNRRLKKYCHHFISDPCACAEDYATALRTKLSQVEAEITDPNSKYDAETRLIRILNILKGKTR